ncbi:hypothetical protein [Sphaerimonospora thailandensis]|uniref:Uncharacterized protein n=1 Tax=Sphaerimonospora thailandensis TaxID=795644 RepID=A0A8J3RD32_9ACTN|nr:hypothetical protein [Sphaerimonospora thailandensis]GIH70303.1 hypothetical protein Mth01_25560 [Sphaerimonospora thailandensis]
MDLAQDLRTAQAAYDTADRALTAARATLDGAGKAYDSTRRRTPRGVNLERARQAWGLALLDWATALIARETAKDTLAAERRTTDQAVADELHLPTRSPR